jgi:ElaB/YqjD/DUF883 family membrane-anchored ribosome-binding protein
MAIESLEKTATLDDVLREFSKMRSMVADAVDDGVRSALRSIRKGRSAAEDVYEDAADSVKRAVRQNPLETVAIAVAAVVITGSVLGWVAMRRR